MVFFLYLFLSSFILHHLSLVAPDASASLGFDVFLEIFLAIVVREFLSRGDLPLGDDEYPTVVVHRFAVGFAGMVDISRLVPSRRSVDVPLFIDTEDIEVAAFVRTADPFADVLDDRLSAREIARRIESEPGA